MFGENQRADTDKHQQGGNDNAAPVGTQPFFAVGIFVHQPLGNENGIIVPLTEYEGSQNNIDNVEFHRKNVHQSQNPEPTNRERQK